MSLNFVAIDVETANSNRGSVCAFGVTIVENGYVTDSHQMLTTPPKEFDWFDGFNIGLHGIRPEDVMGAPSFAQRLADVLAIVGEQPVVAHNAAFDIGAIRMGCNADGLDWPTLSYACSLIMSRRSGLGLLSYRLPIVCDALGIPRGRHHSAGEDAQAAAEVVLALAARHGVGTLDDLVKTLQIRLGKITQTEWASCIQLYSGISGEGGRLRPPDANAAADPDHPLYAKRVAFTGGLSVTRAQAWAAIANLGAIPQQGPTKDTDYLVIGDGFNGNAAAEFHTGKAIKAVKVNAKGGHIEVLTEGDLWEMFAETHTFGTRPNA